MKKATIALALCISLAAAIGVAQNQYYVHVAATEHGVFTGPYRFAFGYHSSSGNQAGITAKNVCQRDSGRFCSTIGIASSLGGCKALSLGSWANEGEEPRSQLFSGSSTFGRASAEQAAVQQCEGTMRVMGQFGQWRCSVRGSFCSSDAN